ncbi:DUF2203 domain-containing protein [Candidatus Micrarchaeota archaeon]|nr:DUF2203 domain-containing protein [Candidatus Micrarchaeota archaeon]
MKRYFTLEEANKSLGKIEPLVKRSLELRKDARSLANFTVYSEDQATFFQENVRASKKLHEIHFQFYSLMEQLADEGVVVKDPDLGLVDFPSWREGEEVYLCWKPGEPQVAYWHDKKSGFGGRKPISIQVNEALR